MGKPANKRLGDILLEFKVISQEQLETALKRQEQEKGKYLGEILVEMGVSQDTINKTLDRFNKRKSLGEVFVDLKFITSDQLEAALKTQKLIQSPQDRRPLGQLLLQLGYITYDNLMIALSKHFNMPVYCLDEFIPDPSLQKIIGEKFAQENKILVLEYSHERVRVGLADPSHYLIAELNNMVGTKAKIEMYLVHPIQAEICLRKLLNPFAINYYR